MKTGFRRPGAFLLPIGVGAGNIGDELVHRAFWQQLDPAITLEVPVFPLAARQHRTYPPQHHYVAANSMPSGPALLIGGTISEAEGLRFPLEFLAPRLLRCHERGWWVDVIGTGVDHLRSARARSLFAEAFLPIRWWRVRTERCRHALLDLGVAPERVQVAADWGWLYRETEDRRQWAREVWRNAGWDGTKPLAVLDIIRPPGWIEEALRELSKTFQLGFFCNEIRPESEAAGFAELRRLGISAPREYYSPDEAVGLVAAARLAIGQRYHFCVQAAIAKVPIVLLPRKGEKIEGLAAELGAPIAGSAASLLAAAGTQKTVETEHLRTRAARLAESLPLDAGNGVRAEHALVLHVGGLGDLVLAGDFFASLRRRFQEVTLVCRRGAAEALKLMETPPSRVIELDFNPYLEATPSARLCTELEALEGRLPKADVFISAEFKPTWLTWFVAASLKETTNCFVSQPTEAPGGMLAALLRDFGREVRAMAAPAPRQYAHERDRYAALAALFGDGNSVQRWNRFPCPDGLISGQYVVCFPGGAAQVALKTWGADRFRSVMEQLPLPLVVMGDESDIAALREAAPPGATVWVGGPGKLGDAAGVVSHARAWIGNDSGLAHVAQAYGVPGVVVFGGGGGWPVYGPWGPGTVGVVMELGCFGCEWACSFDRAYCYREIPVEAVSSALTCVLGGKVRNPEIRPLPAPAHLSFQVTSGAARRRRQLEAELQRRMDALIEIQFAHLPHVEDAARTRLAELTSSHEESRNLRAANEDLRRSLEASHRHASELERQAAERLKKLETAQEELERLHNSAEQMRIDWESSHEWAKGLEQSAAERLRLIEQLERERVLLMEVSTARAAELGSAHEEIERLCIARDEAAAARLAAEQRAEAMAQSAAERLDLIGRLEQEREILQAAADQRLQELERAQQEIVRLREAAGQRLVLLEEAQREIERQHKTATERQAALETATEALRQAGARVRASTATI
ncbi:MAG: hypothetical protein IT168_31575 [Bryobacterales bacterium]|nr:hypothetical protein [Bryobacterales bacterium]